jgi:hypothetical protein
MIYINNIKIVTPEQLEEAILGMSDNEKICLRNDFYGITNEVVQAVQFVTPRQMRIALVMSGISLDTVEAAIDSLPEPNKTVARITWEYSVEFQRNNPLLVAMAPALGLTSTQIDNLFALASTL